MEKDRSLTESALNGKWKWSTTKREICPVVIKEYVTQLEIMEGLNLEVWYIGSR